MREPTPRAPMLNKYRYRAKSYIERNDAAMMFHFEPLRWADAQAVARWHYDGVYAFYDQGILPMATLVLLRGPMRMLGLEAFIVRDERGNRVGVFTFTRRGRSTEIGLAMCPGLTGHGFGLDFVRAGLDFARARYAPTQFTLDVATFNERARIVYERAGFRPLETFTRYTRQGQVRFLAMARPA